MGVGISLVRRGCLLIRRTQCPHQQACRFVAYLIHIPGRPDQRAMTKAEETGHHDINIGFQFPRRDIRSGEGSELADATAIVINESSQSLCHGKVAIGLRSEEHTSELHSLMRNSYDDFCLKKNKRITTIKD